MPQADTTWSIMTYNGVSLANPTVAVDALFEGTARTTYVTLVSGYADVDNHVFVKVQGSGNFSTVFFYWGNQGGSKIGSANDL